MPCATLQKAATVIASAAGRHGGGFSPDPYDTNLGSPIGHAAYEMKRFVGLGCSGLLSDDIVADESRSGAAVVEMCCGMRCAVKL